jgi:plastocyanin
MNRAATAALALLSAASLVVACFSDRSTGTTTRGAAECQVPVSVIDSMHFIVAIRDFAFQPDSIHVPLGATVTWVNCEIPPQEPHTTTSDSGVWGSPDLIPGARFSHTFVAAGAYPYHCTPHPFMLGKVIVQ